MGYKHKVWLTQVPLVQGLYTAAHLAGSAVSLEGLIGGVFTSKLTPVVVNRPQFLTGY